MRAKDGPRPLLEFLCIRFPQIPRDRWVGLIQRDQLQVDGQVAAAITEVREGMRVSCELAEHIEPPTQNDWKCLFEDEHVIIVDKPGDLPCHRNGPYIRSNLMFMLRMAYPDPRLYLMSRLDRETSGVILVARTQDACRAIHQSSSHRKSYLCVVRGQAADQILCTAPIGPIRGDGYKRQALTGKAAETHFETLDRSHTHSLILARPRTGRTHQIRCHLESLGLPLIGEKVYRTDEGAGLGQEREMGAHRQLLHATELTFSHPERGSMSIECPPPADLQTVCRHLGLQLPLP